MDAASNIPPRITDRSRSLNWGIAITAAAVLICCAVIYFFNPQQHAFYPFCIFHRMTGLQCPGCGILRACHELMHLNFLQALRFNPLFVLSLPLILFMTVRNLLRQRNHAAAPSSHAVWWVAGVLLLFGILRNVPAVRQTLLTF